MPRAGNWVPVTGTHPRQRAPLRASAKHIIAVWVSASPSLEGVFLSELWLRDVPLGGRVGSANANDRLQSIVPQPRPVSSFLFSFSRSLNAIVVSWRWMRASFFQHHYWVSVYEKKRSTGRPNDIGVMRLAALFRFILFGRCLVLAMFKNGLMLVVTL